MKLTKNLDYLTVENINQLEFEYRNAHRAIRDLMFKVIEMEEHIKKPLALKHCRYGLQRRLAGIQKSIDFFSKVFAKEVNGKRFTSRTRFIHSALLNHFFINVSGAMDNLAWMIVAEKEIKIDCGRVSLFNDKLKRKLSKELKDHFTKTEKWLGFQKNFRDSVAHRILPYIIPYVFDQAGNKTYNSMYTHDFEDSYIIPLHPQMIADTKGICEILQIGIKFDLGFSTRK